MIRLFFVALVSLVSAGFVSAAEPGPEGIWRTTNGKITVKVAYCGEPHLCATIVGLKHPLDKNGNPKVDHENPSPALRSRPVIGLQIISDMKPDGDSKWRGEIYNADDGNTYAATAKFEARQLLVKGCWMFICKKLHFARMPDSTAKEAKIQ